MARMPLLAETAVGGRRRLVDLWATAPSAVNWQEPNYYGQEQDSSYDPSRSLDTKYDQVLPACIIVFFFVGLCACGFFCRNKKDDDEDHTSRFVLQPWMSNNNDDAQGVSAPVQEQQPPESGDVELTEADMEWMLADMEILAPAADVDMEPAVDDQEIAPAPEPGPTLKCTYRTADGWAEPGTCSVCLAELVDGEMVRVLTACMHCFHATCIKTWLRGGQGNTTCPLCRAPVLVTLPSEPNRSLA